MCAFSVCSYRALLAVYSTCTLFYTFRCTQCDWCPVCAGRCCTRHSHSLILFSMPYFPFLLFPTPRSPDLTKVASRPRTRTPPFATHSLSSSLFASHARLHRLATRSTLCPPFRLVLSLLIFTTSISLPSFPSHIGCLPSVSDPSPAASFPRFYPFIYSFIHTIKRSIHIFHSFISFIHSFIPWDFILSFRVLSYCFISNFTARHASFCAHHIFF